MIANISNASSLIPRVGYLFRVPIIGKVNLVKIHTTESIRESLSAQERAFGDYRDGRFAWECNGAVLFPHPIKVKGKLSIWDYDIDKYEDLSEYPEPIEPDMMGQDYREQSERMWHWQHNVK